MPHAAIIGAGPAGCTAAILLARASGWRVTLVEQHRFPRDKVCGECLSALGIEVLERIGLTRAARELEPVVLTRTVVHAPNGSRLSTLLPRPMWGVARRRFDSFLLDAARAAGADVLQPARCERIEDGAVTVRMLASNAMQTLRPDHILLADGKGALLPARPAPTRDFGIKAHFTRVDGPRDAIELFGAHGCYGGLAGIEQDRWNAAFAVPRSRLRACDGDVSRTFDEILDENAVLRLRLRGARQITPWLSAPLPRFGVAPDWSNNVTPIGNAAAALEPIGGEGMGLAMRSAELAAEELIQSHCKGRSPRTASLRAGFDRLWRTRRLACRAAGVAVSSPRVANLGLRLMPGALTSLALRLTGK